VAAETMAIDTQFYKRATFAISSFLTGVGGGIGAVSTGFVSADSYNFFISITLLVGAVIGGFRSIFGSIFGAAFIVLLPMYLEKVGQGVAWAAFGAACIFMVWVMPEGFAGLFSSVRTRLRGNGSAANLSPQPPAPFRRESV
jgi:branched-chain amino acid transport system permease protein